MRGTGTVDGCHVVGEGFARVAARRKEPVGLNFAIWGRGMRPLVGAGLRASVVGMYGGIPLCCVALLRMRTTGCVEL